MNEPDASPLPLCERCRKETVCVRVETAYGDRTICYAACFKLFGAMRRDLKLRVAQLLAEHDADFFDAPTRPDVPTIAPDVPTLPADAPTRPLCKATYHDAFGAQTCGLLRGHDGEHRP